MKSMKTFWMFIACFAIGVTLRDDSWSRMACSIAALSLGMRFISGMESKYKVAYLFLIAVVSFLVLTYVSVGIKLILEIHTTESLILGFKDSSIRFFKNLGKDFIWYVREVFKDPVKLAHFSLIFVVCILMVAVPLVKNRFSKVRA
jgi:hypothetical protein